MIKMANGAQLRRLVTEWELLVTTLQAPHGADDEALPNRVGVTVLTGFLGSGKTTLLRHLLQDGHGLKLAAVVNDVGAVNIDGRPHRYCRGRRHQTDQWLQLLRPGRPNWAAPSMASPPQRAPPDGIIIEASGIADPVGMATIVATQGRARLDGVVAVVDATALDSWLDNPATQSLFQRQLDAAHLLVLNKADLASAGMIAGATGAPGRPGAGPSGN